MIALRITFDFHLKPSKTKMGEKLNAPKTTTLYIHAWNAPIWYSLENKIVTINNTGTEIPVFVEEILETLVSKMRICSFYGEPARPIFPDQILNAHFLLGLCKILPFKQEVEVNGVTQNVDCPFRLEPYPLVFNKLETAGELYSGWKDEDFLFSEMMTQKKHMVEQKQGGLNGTGMADSEFDEYWEDYLHCFVYGQDCIRPFRIIDTMFDTPTRHDRILKFYDVKPHFMLVPDFLEAANKTFFHLAIRDANALVLAAFVHNVLLYVYPRIFDNYVTARLAANLILVTNGFTPLVPMNTEYYDAIKADADNTVRTDILENVEISVFAMFSYIVKLYQDKFCQECMAPHSTKLCSRCRTVHYCSSKCQTENWAKHKKFCLNSQNKSTFIYFMTRKTRLLVEAKQILREKDGLRIKMLIK